MLPDQRFAGQPLEFWAYVRLASQRLRYYQEDETPEEDAEEAVSKVVTVDELSPETVEVQPETLAFRDRVTIANVCGAFTSVRVRLSVKYKASHEIEGLNFDPDAKTLTMVGMLTPEHEEQLLAGDNRTGWRQAVTNLAAISRELPRIDTSDLMTDGQATELGKLVVSYLNHRLQLLETIKPNLMDRDEAKAVFEKMQGCLQPRCALPMNKQKKEKRHHAYLTCIVNMLTEQELGGVYFDDNPHGLVTLSKDGKLFRTFSRWLDGAYPGIHDPQAIWEVKEYYGTTTFGSRVADGVYESMLDGMEFVEAASSNRRVLHYLMVDDRFTWWTKGKSYLCRLIDILHMGLVDEILFGKEVLGRWPEIVRSWQQTTS